jgi:putative superfamily III holin-X
MVRSGTPDAAGDQQSLGELVALALKDLSQLLRYEITLAKSELRMDVRRVAVAVALFGFGAFVGCLIVVLLCFCYAYGLRQAGLPGGMSSAFAVVAGTLAVLAVLAALVAWLFVRRVTGMRLTRKTVIDDIGMLRRSGSADSGSGQESVAAGAVTPAAEIPARRLPR